MMWPSIDVWRAETFFQHITVHFLRWHRSSQHLKWSNTLDDRSSRAIHPKTKKRAAPIRDGPSVNSIRDKPATPGSAAGGNSLVLPEPVPVPEPGSPLPIFFFPLVTVMATVDDLPGHGDLVSGQWMVAHRGVGRDGMLHSIVGKSPGYPDPLKVDPKVFLSNGRST
jgi:hypothetical protein